MQTANIYIMTSIYATKPTDGWGMWVFEYPREGKDPFIRPGTVPLKQVNKNEASLLTLISVLSKITEPLSLNVFIEDGWVAAMVSKNLPTWSANGFLRQDGKPIAHEQEWRTVDELLKNHLLVVIKGKRAHSFRKWMRAELKRKTL